MREEHGAIILTKEEWDSLMYQLAHPSNETIEAKKRLDEFGKKVKYRETQDGFEIDIPDLVLPEENEAT